MSPPAAAAAPAVQPRRTTRPVRPLAPSRRPRRVSGPARPGRGAAQRSTGSRTADGGLALAIPSVLARLAGHRLIDRLIAGKAWIGVVAFALIGIVTLQLALLQLNTGIGRVLEREGTLQRENSALSIENSEMEAGDRVESSAARLGMQLVPTGALRFLTPRSSDPTRSVGVLSTPVRSAGETTGEPASGAASAASASATPATNTAQHGQAAGEEGASGSAAGSSGSEHSTAGGESKAAGSEPNAQAPESGSPASAPAAGAETSAPSASGEHGSAETTSAGGTQPGPAG